MPLSYIFVSINPITFIFDFLNSCMSSSSFSLKVCVFHTPCVLLFSFPLTCFELNLDTSGYKYLTVNPTYNFVDPDSGAYAQNYGGMLGEEYRNMVIANIIWIDTLRISYSGVISHIIPCKCMH